MVTSLAYDCETEKTRLILLRSPSNHNYIRGSKIETIDSIYNQLNKEKLFSYLSLVFTSDISIRKITKDKYPSEVYEV
mgnify:CR=1 FL=1